MRVLCLNVGSSSFKWSLIGMPGEDSLAAGEVELDSSTPGSIDLIAVLPKVRPVDAVAHRLVHGGGRFLGATQLDDATVKALEALKPLDPTHTPKALAGIAAARKALPNVPQLACFDTTFHATLRPAAYTYALPSGWNAEWGLRRYGFHGLSVTYAVQRAAALLGKPVRSLLVCHLGSGSSITAVRDGRSVDTSMGFTPLEGLPMSTRSGTVDPGLLLYVMRVHGLSVAEVERALEEDSGLKGLAGTGDLRQVVQRADAGEAMAQQAYAVWMTGVRRGFGAMLAALDGLDCVAFTGGIGEHLPRARAEVLAPFGWCGLGVDAARNASPEGDAVVSAPGAKVSVLRVLAREDLTMAREAEAVLNMNARKASEP